MNTFTKLFISFIVLVLITSCANTREANINFPVVQEKRMPFPPAHYESVFLVDNNILAFSFDSEQDEIEKETLYAYLGDSNLQYFQPIDISGCYRPMSPHLITLLPDGRIGFLSCADAPPNYNPLFFVTPKLGQAFKSIYAIDLKTGEVEKLVQDPLTPQYSPKNFTWSPDMSQGVQEMVDGAQGTLNWISKDGVTPINIEIEVNGRTWNLNGYYKDQTLRKGNGFVISPAWSPDGNTIAFFASDYGVREVPSLTWDIEYNLYFMNPEEQKPLLKLENIINAYNLRWSPNSKLLSFTGCIIQYPECALWVYEIETSTIHFIAEGSFWNTSWSSIETILAIKIVGEPYDDNEIWEYKILDWN